MIPMKERIAVESNIQGQSKEFTVDEAATVHLMGVLIRLYSDREMAALREISTNARDSHIEAGTPERPIEVTLPSPLSQFLKVRDYGVGLSVDDLFEMYTKFGASTKRETNSLNGCLGLGSKSPLAYTDQFSLTTVKNGTKATITVTKRANGVPELTVVDTQATDDHAGVEVVIPVRRFNEFASKAKHLFAFWQPGTVLVNGEEPKPVEGLRVSDEYTIIEGSQDYVVMAGIPYPVNIRHGLRNAALAAWVPTGSVDFVPAREALEDTDATRDALATIAEHFRGACAGVIQSAIDKAASFTEALRIMSRWQNIVPKAARQESYAWNGETLPTTWKDPQGTKIALTNRTGRTLSGNTRYDSIAPSTWLDSTLWVTGYTLKFTAQHKRKLNQYAEDNGLQVTNYVLTQSAPDPRFIDASLVVPWEAVAAVKLPYQSAVSSGYGDRKTQRAGTYDCWIGGVWREATSADEIVGNVYWLQGNYEDTRQYGNAIAHVQEGAILVALPANRVDKFVREWPEARPFREGVTALHTAWFESLGRFDRKALAMVEEDERALRTYRPRYRRHWPRGGVTRQRVWSSERELGDLLYLDAARIADQRLRLAVKLAHRADELRAVRDQFANCGVHTASGLDPLAHPLDNYPLFCQNQADHDHTYIYLNAAYAAGKEQNQ